MSNIFTNSREVFVKALESVSNSTAKLASTAKYKAVEVGLTNRKREILENLGKTSYELWQKGIEFPEEIAVLLKEITGIDDKLTELKAEHFAYLNPEVEKELQDKVENEEQIETTDFDENNVAEEVEDLVQETESNLEKETKANE